MTEHVAAALHDALTGEADTIATPGDPWPGFAARETVHRRARTRRRVAVAGGILALGIGVQTNVVPLPHWMPAVAVAAAPSRLTTGPTRGGLAGDRAWLDGLRGQIAGFADPEGLWQVDDRSKIRIVYAGDVPDRRLALVLVPLRLGLVRDWALAWYAGPSGAAPGAMMRDSGTDADTPVATMVTGSVADGGMAIVVAPAGATVAINGHATYTAAGTVERRPLVTSADGSGVAVVALPPGPQPEVATTVTLDGAPYFAGTVYGGWNGRTGENEDPTPQQLAAAARDARGPGLDRELFFRFTGTALHDSRLPLKGVTFRLLWTGTVNGQSAGLFTLQPEGGGVIVYAMHGAGDTWRVDLRLLVPAEGAFGRPYAWRMLAEGNDRSTDQVVVVAPPGAASVTVTAGAGSPVPVALDPSGRGTLTVSPSSPAVVTAYTSGGTLIASTPLHLLENDGSQLPGDTPGTRVTR